METVALALILYLATGVALLVAFGKGRHERRRRAPGPKPGPLAWTVAYAGLILIWPVTVAMAVKVLVQKLADAWRR